MPTKLATLVSVTLALAMSGCIEAADFAAEMDANFADWEDSWEDDMDHWEHEEGSADCPEDDNATSDHDNETSDATTPDDDHSDGSINASELRSAYADAEPRFHNEIVGSESSERNIRVDLFDGNLRIGLIYHLHGSVEITLRDPLGLKVAEEEFDGSKEAREDNWIDIDDPLPGDYELEIDIDGSGSYTIGVYTDS